MLWWIVMNRLPFVDSVGREECLVMVSGRNAN